MMEQVRVVSHLVDRNNYGALIANLNNLHDSLTLYQSWTVAYTNLQKNIRFAKECIRKIDKAFEAIEYVEGFYNLDSFLCGRLSVYYIEVEKMYKCKNSTWNRKKYLKNLFVFEILAYRYLKNLVYQKMMYWRTRSVYSI
jgi:hypothetical protein